MWCPTHVYVGAEVLSLVSVYFLNFLIVLETHMTSELSMEMALYWQLPEETRLRMKAETDQRRDCSYKSNMAAGHGQAEAIRSGASFQMMCVFMDDCVSSSLYFSIRSPVNNSLTSADSSIFPLIMCSGVNRQRSGALISMQWLSSVAKFWRCSPWKPINKLKHFQGDCFKRGQTLRPLPQNGPKWLPLNNASILIKINKYLPPPICLSLSLICTPTLKKQEKKSSHHCQSLLRTIPRSLGQLWLSKRIPL